MITHTVGAESFMWFFGIVEDVNDPLQLGRVRVRILNYHSDQTATSDLKWASVITPISSASLDGVGASPTGLQVGSFVMGFFIDGGAERQLPILIGSVPMIRDGNQAKHSVPALARGTDTSNVSEIGPEPPNDYAAEYPFNNAINTMSGHSFEMDDTPGSERVRICHRSGSYIELRKDGSVVIKSSKDGYDITVKNKTIYAEGTINIEAKGPVNLKGSTINVQAASGPINISASAGVNIN